MATGRYSLFLLGLLFISTETMGQVNRYMVFFKDKTGTSYSVSQPLGFLSQKALDRRIRQNINVVPADLPVNAT